MWDAGNFGGQYSFVGNSPGSRFDSYGLDWFTTAVDYWGNALGLDTSEPAYRGAGPMTQGSTMSGLPQSQKVRQEQAKPMSLRESAVPIEAMGKEMLKGAGKGPVGAALTYLGNTALSEGIDDFAEWAIDPAIDETFDELERALEGECPPSLGPLEDEILYNSMEKWLKAVLRKYWDKLTPQQQKKVLDTARQQSKNAARKMLKDMGRKALGKGAEQKKVKGTQKQTVTDLPKGYRAERPYIDETPTDFAKRVLGPGKHDKGTGSDWAKLVKRASRGFRRD